MIILFQKKVGNLIPFFRLSVIIMNRPDKLYQDLFKKYVKAHGSAKSKQACQVDVAEIWKTDIKVSKAIDEAQYKAVIQNLDKIIGEKERKGTIVSFFRNPPKKADKTPSEPIVTFGEQQDDLTREVEENNLVPEQEDTTFEDKGPPPTPVQDRLNVQLAERERILVGLLEARDIGLEGETATVLAAKIKGTKAKIVAIKKQLRRRKKMAVANRNYRNRRKAIEDRLKVDHPEFAASMKLRAGVGRPRIECDQPDIMRTILEIATVGAACGDRRRDDLYRTVKTLDDLHKAVSDLGFTVSRSGLYLKLLPRDGKTTEGKRHINTVPVKLIRPQNDLRKKHPDRMFAAETSTSLDQLAAVLGPEACVYSAQDDKSSVFIGKTAAKVQGPLLMNMRVRVRLPDHDFCVGTRHLLVPSVIAHCVIDPKTGVSYSGTTYVAVRSSKHNNSTAFTHNEDMDRFRELHPEIFEVPGTGGELKPVLIKSVDGGPDENPRYENNKKMACLTFQKMNLDCLIEFTQAPGLSAFNRAERKMYPLSKEMTGLVLPHDSFGSHLHNGKTVDEALEILNFEAAGKVLCEVWEKLVLDGYPVRAEYISDGAKEETKKFEVTALYRSRHIIETQYMTCVLKCDDPDCCSPMRSSVDAFFPHRRMPSLIPIRYLTT